MLDYVHVVLKTGISTMTFPSYLRSIISLMPYTVHIFTQHGNGSIVDPYFTIISCISNSNVFPRGVLTTIRAFSLSLYIISTSISDRPNLSASILSSL